MFRDTFRWCTGCCCKLRQDLQHFSTLSRQLGILKPLLTQGQHELGEVLGTKSLHHGSLLLVQLHILLLMIDVAKAAGIALFAAAGDEVNAGPRANLRMPQAAQASKRWRSAGCLGWLDGCLRQGKGLFWILEAIQQGVHIALHVLLSRIQFVAPEGEAPPLRHAAHAAAAAAPSIAAAGGVAGLLDVDEAFAVGEPHSL
mmetsp:Transcript_26598/g.55222  ORF Transcript_26598/g.55222 Transcript_26598/m.55222 type:complete len:200 (-) Transcript_26598:68-667(-)